MGKRTCEQCGATINGLDWIVVTPGRSVGDAHLCSEECGKQFMEAYDLELAWMAKRERELAEKEDKVNHPSHYTMGGIETLDFIKAKLTLEEYQGYLKGNILKYLSRERFKGGFEDLKKAQFYLTKLIETEPDFKECCGACYDKEED